MKTGAREGRPLKRTFQPEHESGDWKLGKPDIVIRVPGFTVPPTGQMAYRYLISGDLFPKDVWVRAAEWRIDQRSAVHHFNAYVRGPDSSYLKGAVKDQVISATIEDRARRRDGERNFDRREQLVGWEPGYAPMPWLEDGAKLVRAGSDIVFEMHFNPNGKAVTDYSELGLYFASAPPIERVLSIDTLRDLDLAIPAGSRETVSRATMTLAHDVKLVSLQPHMHYRGKSMAVRAIYPDGHSEVLDERASLRLQLADDVRIEGTKTTAGRNSLGIRRQVRQFHEQQIQSRSQGGCALGRSDHRRDAHRVPRTSDSRRRRSGEGFCCPAEDDQSTIG